jgi:hypothetical protein
MTSIIGVTLMSALTADGPALPVDMATAGHRLLGLEFLGEDRTADLGADVLMKPSMSFEACVISTDRFSILS